VEKWLIRSGCYLDDWSAGFKDEAGMERVGRGRQGEMGRKGWGGEGRKGRTCRMDLQRSAVLLRPDPKPAVEET